VETGDSYCGNYLKNNKRKASQNKTQMTTLVYLSGKQWRNCPVTEP